MGAGSSQGRGKGGGVVGGPPGGGLAPIGRIDNSPPGGMPGGKGGQPGMPGPGGGGFPQPYPGQPLPKWGGPQWGSPGGVTPGSKGGRPGMPGMPGPGGGMYPQPYPQPYPQRPPQYGPPYQSPYPQRPPQWGSPGGGMPGPGGGMYPQPYPQRPPQWGSPGGPSLGGGGMYPQPYPGQRPPQWGGGYPGQRPMPPQYGPPYQRPPQMGFPQPYPGQRPPHWGGPGAGGMDPRIPILDRQDPSRIQPLPGPGTNFGGDPSRGVGPPGSVSAMPNLQPAAGPGLAVPPDIRNRGIGQVIHDAPAPPAMPDWASRIGATPEGWRGDQDPRHAYMEANADELRGLTGPDSRARMESQFPEYYQADQRARDWQRQQMPVAPPDWASGAHGGLTNQAQAPQPVTPAPRAVAPQAAVPGSALAEYRRRLAAKQQGQSGPEEAMRRRAFANQSGVPGGRRRRRARRGFQEGGIVGAPEAGGGPSNRFAGLFSYGPGSSFSPGAGGPPAPMPQAPPAMPQAPSPMSPPTFNNPVPSWMQDASEGLGRSEDRNSLGGLYSFDPVSQQSALPELSQGVPEELSVVAGANPFSSGVQSDYAVSSGPEGYRRLREQFRPGESVWSSDTIGIHSDGPIDLSPSSNSSSQLAWNIKNPGATASDVNRARVGPGWLDFTERLREGGELGGFINLGGIGFQQGGVVDPMNLPPGPGGMPPMPQLPPDSAFAAEAEISGPGGMEMVEEAEVTGPGGGEEEMMAVFSDAREALEANMADPAALGRFRDTFGDAALLSLGKIIGPEALAMVESYLATGGGGEEMIASREGQGPALQIGPGGPAPPYRGPGSVPTEVMGFQGGGSVPFGGGDGMSDSIPGNIDGGEQVALSEGEYVVPADAVSHLGNGSTEAGGRRMGEMVAEIRRARTGNGGAPGQIDPRGMLG